MSQSGISDYSRFIVRTPNSAARALSGLGRMALLALALFCGAARAEPPPSPEPVAELLSNAPAPYPRELLSEGFPGEAILRLWVDESGDVEEAEVTEATHPAFGASALHAATRLKFKPFTKDGAPLRAAVEFRYRFAQVVAPGKLWGVVRSKGNRRPLSGAAVKISGTEEVAETDDEGRFELSLPPGEQTLRVTAVGFHTGSWVESVHSNEALEVNYSLEPLAIQPYETVVRAERERTEVSRITLRDQELREVPGTFGDPFRVVMLLPGVTSMLSGVAYPVVRGSMPAATGYFLDGIRIPILFHLLMGLAVIHPDFIDSIDFYPASPPLEHGRVLGGVIGGKLRRPRNEFYATGYADFINAGTFIDIPFKSSGTQLTMAGRASYTGWLIALLANSVFHREGQSNLVLNFYDYQGRLEQKIGRGTTRLLAFGSSDLAGLTPSDSSPTRDTQSIVFHRVDLEHRHPLGEGELKIGTTWGVDRLGFTNADSYTSQNYALNEGIWAARFSLRSSKNKQFQLSWGADIERREATVQLRFGPLSSIVSRERPVALGTIGGTWLQGIWAPSAQWRLIPGLRVDRYHLVSDFTAVGVEPRVAVRYSPTEPLTLKLGAGLFHQPPVTLISLPAADLDALHLGLQKGAQFSIGAEWKLPRDFELSAEVYFSPLMRAFEIDPFGTTGEPDAPTVGRAYGLELMLRRALGGGWFGWISYTLSRSERRRTFGRHDRLGDIVSFDTANLPFAFDQTHVLNAVVSRRFPGNWSLGAAFHFNTGIPEAGGITSRTLVASEGGEITRWVASDLDRVRRLPPFFRFDIRVGKSWAYDDFTLDLYLDFFNAALQKEVTGYDYTYDGEGGRRGMARNPRSIPLFLPVLGAKGTY